MFVSVIIPTYKRAKDLKVALDSLCNQIILPNEVIIVDQSPDHETRDLCNEKKYKKIGMRCFWRDDASSARARNQGIEKLHKGSDVVLFFDDDVEVDKKYIEKVVSFLKHNEHILGGEGNVLNHPQKKTLGYYLFLQPWIKGYTYAFDVKFRNPLKIQTISVMYGCDMFIRASVLRQGYRFPQWMDRYSFEDLFLSYDLTQRYPSRFVYLPFAKIYHYESISARIPNIQRVKQFLSHLFFFYNLHSFFLLRFYWVSIGYFIRIFFLTREKRTLFVCFFFTWYWLFINRRKILTTPSCLNDFIFNP